MSLKLKNGKRRTLKEKPSREDSQRLLQRIQESAYFRAEQRDFSPGFELEDWLSAEREITG